ncbi:MAG: diadenylate cyclase CdaA [Oscillospiraceae bacterium]|nr:diadenylate cyclase CdaA [Oscillospiraceae bacterium]
MLDSLLTRFTDFYNVNILSYLELLHENPYRLITLIIDIVLVLFLTIKMVQVLRKTRAWQLVKGLSLLILITLLSGFFGLRILNSILASLMTYGVIVIIIIFQPELRRGLEQLGTRKLSKFFGIEKDIKIKTKEKIYKVVNAAVTLASTKTGALIVIERDINLKDIIETGILVDAEISSQLLVNVFQNSTPLHDGAVVLSGNKIKAAACMLPISNDQNISKGLGARHRSASGISKESDCIVVVVSEETGKISIAKEGTLIVDVTEDALKQILIKNLIIKRFEEEEEN